MIKGSDKNLSDAIVEIGILPKAEVDSYLKVIQPTEESLDAYLIRNGILSKQQILSSLEKKFRIQVIDLQKVQIDQGVIERIPVKLAWYYKFMPIRIENKVLTIAASIPLDVKVQDEIRVNLGYEPHVLLACELDILEALKKYYGLAADMIDRILTKQPAKKSVLQGADHWVEDIEQKSSDASVTKLVNQIILEAYRKRATDIHIEPYRDKVRFRYRIDGALVDANLPIDVKHFILPILSRIKIMSNLSIVEKRIPQDGSAVVKTQDQTLDLRVSTIPTPQGESMVIRILPTKVMNFRLGELGLDPENVTVFRKLISKAHGVIFVTGPTGSGKTTTLYACLNEVNSIQRKIITIEDPVEYEMENVTQIQVNPKVGLTFSAGLRSVLRHDPDIIMVGEVRDLETAEIAIRTALTGHLVFSTLHTNDAASGITRLVEMNVEPYLVSSSIEAFAAQRLVRVICTKCKVEMECPDELRREIASDLGMQDVQEIRIFKGNGCDRCGGTGYYGRTAIYEILLMTDAIRSAILEKSRADFIKKIAVENGMRTLRQDGWQKVLEGTTTPSEVMNVTVREEISDFQEKEESVFIEKISTHPKRKSVDDEKRYELIAKDALAEKKEINIRTHLRLNKDLVVEYRLLQGDSASVNAGSDKDWQKTHTKNIGAGGILMKSSFPLPIGSVIEMKLVLEPTESPVVECLSRVCRVEKDGDGKNYNIVIYFLDISSADRARISNYVKEEAES